MPNRLLALTLALALAVAACTDDASPDTGATTAPGPTTAATDAPPATEADPGGGATTTTAAPVTVTVAPPRVGEAVDPAVAAALRDEVAALIAATEEVRGLKFLEPPTLAVVSEAELVRLVLEDAAEDLDGIGPTERLLRLLGIIDEATDLRALLEGLLAEQVLGYYDGETGEMVVRGDQAELSQLSRITIVHELIHALTDQHFSFFGQFEVLLDEERYDEAAALQALVEGDATYFQLVYLQESLDLGDLVALQDEITAQDFSLLESSPEYLQADLMFPYDDGFRFVSAIVEEGGIAAVDRAYAELPTTTEQILHPERYAAGEQSREVALPETPLDGYEVHEESMLGEWGLSLFFIDREDRGLVAQIGDGWGGDRYRILDNGTDVAMLTRYQADLEADAIEVTQAWLALFTDRFGDGVEDDVGVGFESEAGYGFVDREGDRVTVIVASDPAVGPQLRAAAGGG